MGVATMYNFPDTDFIMNKKFFFANVFSISLLLTNILMNGCSKSEDITKSETPTKEVALSQAQQVEQLNIANKVIFSDPKTANDIAKIAENWKLEPNGQALRQWIHTQQQANRGNYDQAWSMIHEVDHSQLSTPIQAQAQTLYWRLATILNACPQWSGTHEQQIKFLAVTQNQQCEQTQDKALQSFVQHIEDFHQPDWEKSLQNWHSHNSQHWANEFVHWNKLKPHTADPIQIAVVLPLSGEQANVGKAIQQGILTTQPLLSQLTLSFHDSAELGAQKALEAAINTHPKAIIGPLNSQDLNALSNTAHPPILAFAPSQYPKNNLSYIAHDPYQVPRLLQLAKKMGHSHLVWLTDPAFVKMQRYWPESVARLGQIPIKSDELKALLAFESAESKRATNTNLQYDGLMLLGHNTAEIQMIAHELITNPVQTFLTEPDASLQQHFFEETVALKSPWLDDSPSSHIEYSPFSKVLSQINAKNQTWYNAVGIDSLLIAYYLDELQAINLPVQMATGIRTFNKNASSLKLHAHHVQDGQWHPILSINIG